MGANGAGKTTLIRHVLGLLKPQRGSVRVFGLDPVKEPVAVLSRIGYLSEEGDLPGWMRVDDLMRYMRAFYPSWDEGYAQQLRKQFELDPAAKVKGLSKGQKARAGLLVALAYRPELLLLDEPSSGLDPIVRRDILGAIVRTIADEGRTVLFSSHLLDEVERISDRIAMLKGGRILFTGELDEIKQMHHRLTLRFDGEACWRHDLARDIVPWLIGLLLVAKLALATTVVRSLDRSGLVGRSGIVIMIGIWMFVVIGLCSIAFVFLPTTQFAFASIASGIALFTPFSRLAGAVLALAWNRHR